MAAGFISAPFRKIGKIIKKPFETFFKKHQAGLQKTVHILNKYSIDGVISPLSHLSIVEWLTVNIFDNARTDKLCSCLNSFNLLQNFSIIISYNGIICEFAQQ